MNPLLLVGAALLLFKGTRGGKEPAGRAQDDGARLVLRANTPGAKKWLPHLINHGVLPMVADALVRWIGIESGGNPLTVSPIQERGLLQCSPAVAKDCYTEAEWASLINKSTTAAEHARLAIKLYTYLWRKASVKVKNPPSNPLDQVWYAKLQHQWPKDVSTGNMHGPAMLMSRELALKWAANARQMHYLRAANVVAWNVSAP